MDIFSKYRREPRVKINTRVLVSGSGEGGEFCQETVTVDVSPHGAAFPLDFKTKQGAILDFKASDYSFHTQAVVRCVVSDRSTGRVIVGVEYLGDTRNPLVIWG